MDQLKKLQLKYPNVTFVKCNVSNYGEIIVLDTDTIVSQFFIKNSIWEGWMAKYFKQYVIENTFAIDVGANIGSHTLLMSKVSSPKSILAFEPYRMNFDILNENISLNKLQNIVTFNFGLAEKEKFLYEDNLDYTVNTNFAGRGLVLEGKPANQVQLYPLDDIVDDRDVISFIKIDVEGAEISVLEGAKKTITRNRPTLIIELWDHIFEQFLMSDIYSLLKSLGYKYEKVSPMDYLFTTKEK